MERRLDIPLHIRVVLAKLWAFSKYEGKEVLTLSADEGDIYTEQGSNPPPPRFFSSNLFL